MPTKRERQYYRDGYSDGYRDGAFKRGRRMIYEQEDLEELDLEAKQSMTRFKTPMIKRKRKLSAWQKYIKNKRNHIKYRDGKLNLKKMGVAFRRKKRRR